MWPRRFDGRWKSSTEWPVEKKKKIVWFSADFLFPTSETSRIFRCIASTFPSVVRSNRCQFFLVQYFIRKFEFYAGVYNRKCYILSRLFLMSICLIEFLSERRHDNLELNICFFPVVVETEAMKLISAQSCNFIIFSFIYYSCSSR